MICVEKLVSGLDLKLVALRRQSAASKSASPGHLEILKWNN